MTSPQQLKTLGLSAGLVNGASPGTRGQLDRKTSSKHLEFGRGKYTDERKVVEMGNGSEAAYEEHPGHFSSLFSRRVRSQCQDSP